MIGRLPYIVTCTGLCLISFWLGFFAYLKPAMAPSIRTTLPTSGNRELPPNSATLTFVGDVMLAREVERAIINHGVDWPFTEITENWTDSDLVIGNFESTIRDAYRYEGEVLAFDVAPDYVTGLKNAGFTHLSLANNHGNDFGSAITDYTRDTIAGLGITPFGDPVHSEQNIAHVTVNNIAFSLVGFHAFIEDPATVAEAISNEAEQGYFVIVMPHWGNEYETWPSTAQTSAARMFVDAGADLIVGGHPHVIQPIENIEGVPVAYSLGNFVFDQDWSVPTTQGLMLTVTVTDAAVTITSTPISVNNRQATVGDFTVQETLTFIRQ